MKKRKDGREEYDLQSNLKGLKTFNELKRVIHGCRLKQGEKGSCNLINVTQLKSLLYEVRTQIEFETTSQTVNK